MAGLAFILRYVVNMRYNIMLIIVSLLRKKAFFSTYTLVSVGLLKTEVVILEHHIFTLVFPDIVRHQLIIYNGSCAIP